MFHSKFEEFLFYLRDKKILITTHDLVDIDGFVSCIILQFFFNEYFNQPVSVFFAELSKLTRNFMKKFTTKFPNYTFDYETDIDPNEYDICLLVDTNDISQLRFNHSRESQLVIPYIIIDHHHFNKTKQNNVNFVSLNLISDKISSSAEIVLKLLESQNQDLTTPQRYLLAAAIIIDSGFFKYGNNDTIKTISKLLDNKVIFQDLLPMLEAEVDVSEKIAKIKGLQRVDLIRSGDYLIGVSNVSSFGASVSSMLIKNGFDIAIVYSEEKDKKIINSRANKNICLKTGLHLGKILEDLSEYSEGSGGGHDGAASITFHADLEKVLSKFVEKIKQFL
ncbi:MAG: bifunctional oligoribonuclease/PAP phosphatase NrnA [Promethearchaeota archaeon]